MGLWVSFIFLNCQVVEWVDIFANPVFKNPGINCTEITKGQLLNLFKIGEMSLAILSYEHVLCPRAHMVRISTFLTIIILIFFACALRHCRVMTGHYVTLKYQAKPWTIAWKVLQQQQQKWLDSTNFALQRTYLVSGTHSTGIIAFEVRERNP